MFGTQKRKKDQKVVYEEKDDDNMPPPPPPDEEKPAQPYKVEFAPKPVVSNKAVNNANQLFSDLAGAKGKSENELLQAAMKLQEISSNKLAAKRMNKNREAVRTLIQAIKEKPRFGKLVEYSVDCLTNLCIDDDTCMDLIDEGVLEVLQDIMKINPFNEKLQRAVGRCLEKMTLTPAFSEQIAKQGAMDLIVNSLNKHHEDLTHEQNSITVVKMFKDSPANVAMFVEKGGLKAVAKVMADNADNPKTLASMGAIVTELARDPKIAAQLHKLGMLDSMLEALVTYPENAGIVKAAIQFFNNLIKADRKFLDEIRTKGGIDAAILAMELNPDDEQLLDLGAQLMNNMSGEAELLHSIKAVGGQDFTSAAAVAKIGNLALVGDNVDYIMANGGVQALITAIKIARATPDSDESKKIIESAIRAFGRLCNNTPHVQMVITQGGLDCILETVKDFGDNNVEIMAEGINDLARMADNKDHAVVVANAGGIKAALHALEVYPDNQRVVNAVLDYMTQNAKFNSAGSAQFVKDGGIPQLLGMLSQYIDSPDMLLNVLNTLMGLLEASPDTMKAFVDAQGMEKLIEVLDAQIDNPKVVQAILTVFDKLATDERNAQKIRDTDEISDSIFAAIEKHAANEAIQNIGAELVGKLSSKDEFGTMVLKINEWLSQLLKANDAQQQAIGQKIIKHIQKIADLAQIPEQAKILAEKGAVDAVLAAFKTALQMKPGEVRDGIVSAAATATVRFLAEDLVDPSQITYEMYKAILDHAVASTENEALALKAALLAQELAAEDATAKKMIKDGAIQKLLTLSSYFPLNDAILASVVVAIGRLAAADPDAIKQILAAGGHELVVMSAYTNMENVDNLLNALSVLATLAIDNEASDMILKAGAMEVLIKALRLYPENVEVQTMAMEMLNAMAISEDVIKQLGDAGLLPLLIKAMGDFKEIEDLQKAVLNLLSKLATNHDFVLKMLELNCSDILLALADAHPENAEIQDIAANLLTVFADNLVEPEVDEMQFDEIKVEEGIENIKSATADVANMEQEQSIKVIEQLKSLSSSKGAVWKLAQEGGFGTLMDILMNNMGDQSVVLACLDALDEMLTNVGEEIGHIENIEEVITSITQTMVALESLNGVDPDKIKAMLKHLYNISKVKDNRKALIKKGILDPLLKMFDTYQDDAEILTDLAKLLGLYGAEEEMWKKFLRDNTIRALINAMRKFIAIEKFEQYGEYLLGTLALYEPLKVEIARCDGIEVTAQIMEKWESSPGVISNSNYCLANCSFNNDDVVSRIIGCPALQQVINSMDNHTEVPDLLESAATVISNLCYGNDGNKELIARLGAAKSLVDVVLRNYSRPHLLIAAFRAIGNLAYYLDNVPIIIQEGAVQGIVAGMTVHVDDLEVIKVALGVMTNLAADAKEENQAIMAQEGAVQAICEVTNAHADNEEVEMAAISCLVNLVQEEYNSAMVVRQGGVLGVVKAMQALAHDTELMQTGMRLIFEVSKNEKMASKIIKTPNGIESICSLMEKYPTDPSISSDGLRAFFHLASNKDNADKVGKRGGLGITMKIVETRMKDLPQLKEALRALGSLARSEAMANQMAVPSMALVQKALQSYYKDNVLCELVLGFIGNVACFDSSAELISNTDIIPIVISTTKAKQEQKIVVLRGLRALENIAYASDNTKSKLKKEGALLAIDTIKKFWNKDEEVEQACVAAMDAILARRKRDQNSDVFSNIRARLKDGAKLDGKELPQATKNMLIAGNLMTKHSSNALPHPKHIFVSRDLKKLCWRDPKKPNEEAKFLKMAAIKVINKGRCTPQLRRRNAFGKHYAKDERSFACLTKDRNISLECGTEQERDEWVEALTLLKAYQKLQKQGQAKPE